MRPVLALLAAALILPCAPAAGAGRPPDLTVKVGANPAWLFFADRVRVRVEVVVDPRRVDPGTIRVDAPFGAWQEIGPPESSSATTGSVALRSWTYTLTCLGRACLPHGPVSQKMRLPGLTVTARRLDGRTLAVRRDWPVLNVSGRFLPPGTGNVTPAFRIRTELPPATYRIGPSGLRLALNVLGLLAAAVALALVGIEVLRWSRARHETVDRRPPLVRALALVREAQARRSDDRRRAVGLLARTLPRDDGLRAVASEVAWSNDDPSPERLEELARTVEADLRERT